MCSGDLTIEWPREEHDGRRFAFDGWGVPHHCVNWVCVAPDFPLFRWNSYFEKDF